MSTQHAAAVVIPAIGFGDRLRRLRLELGLDQRQMAQEIGGIDHATLSRYESSSRTPRSAPHIAASVQLRFGSADVDLRTWLLTGVQPTGFRPPRPGIPMPRDGHRHVIYAHEHNHSSLRRAS